MMTNQDFVKLCKKTVAEYTNKHLGDKNEVYVDAYKKWENICIPL